MSPVHIIDDSTSLHLQPLYLQLHRERPMVNNTSHKPTQPLCDGQLILKPSWMSLASPMLLVDPLQTSLHINEMSLPSNDNYLIMERMIPFDFSVLARPSSNGGQPTPTPKSSVEYVSASSTYFVCTLHHIFQLYSVSGPYLLVRPITIWHRTLLVPCTLHHSIPSFSATSLAHPITIWHCTHLIPLFSAPHLSCTPNHSSALHSILIPSSVC